MNKVIDTLEFIQNNPGCNSATFDYGVVKDLHSLGYIEGVNASSHDGGAFINLRITIKGEAYLESLKNPESVKCHAANEAAYIPNNWHNKALGKIFIGVVIIILGAMALFAINHHLSLNLG